MTMISGNNQRITIVKRPLRNYLLAFVVYLIKIYYTDGFILQ